MKTFRRILVIALLVSSNSILFAQKETKPVSDALSIRQYQKLNSNKAIKQQYYGKLFSKSAGDYLVQAGNNYLLGVGLGIAGGVVVAVSDNNVELIYAGAGLALSGFVCTIIGHTKLKKAGEKLNENKKLSFHPSTSGIGLALKF